MAKISKRMVNTKKLITKQKVYILDEAIKLVKKTSTTKFDSTIELIFNLNIDLRKTDQQIRGALVLPAGIGKIQKILVLTNTKVKEAKNAKADFVGGEELITKIQKENWFEFDVIIATPEIMIKLGTIGKKLGPKGLMPNSKTGTVTIDVAKAIAEIKKGKIKYHADKEGNIHTIIGKSSFTENQLKQNFITILNEIYRVKPQTIKGNYIKNISISSTMGPGIKVKIN